MTLDGSMAVWAFHQPGQNGARAELHFNYWRISGDPDFVGGNVKDAKDFAEIGVLLNEPNKVESVSIFLPVEHQLADLSDCGPHFADVDIAQGIFNEPLTCTSAGPPGPTRIELIKGTAPYCRVHKFPLVTARLDPAQIDISPLAGGTRIVIKRLALKEVCDGLGVGVPAYFRVRVSFERGGENPFIQVIRPRDRLFQSGFEEVEYVDFRFNEARTLPGTVTSEMRSSSQPPITFEKIAFLTAIPVASNLTSSNAEPHKSRLLEHRIWTTYVKNGIPKGMMVYHWRKSDPAGVADFSAFVKLVSRRSGNVVLAKYLFVALIFGILGNLIASGVLAIGQQISHPHSNLPSSSTNLLTEPVAGAAAKTDLNQPDQGKGAG